MKNPQKPVPATYADPLTPDRVAPYIGDISRQGSELITKLSDKINEVTVRRAFQIGYMMACQDHGIALPEFSDPADTVLKGL